MCIFLILFLVLFEKMLYNGIIPKESSWLRGIFFLCASSYNRLGLVEHTNAASFLTALTYFYLLWTSLYISSIPAVINGRNFIFCKGFFKPYHFIQQNSPTEKGRAVFSFLFHGSINCRNRAIRNSGCHLTHLFYTDVPCGIHAGQGCLHLFIHRDKAILQF